MPNLVVRLNADGSLDTSFGTGGLLTFPDTPGATGIDAVAVQPDGKIVLAGGSGGTVAPPAGGTYDFDFLAMRLAVDGTFDSTFGTGGRVMVPFNLTPQGNDGANAIAVRPDGDIVLAGAAAAAPSQGGIPDEVQPTEAAVARLLPDGQLDPAFGGGGTVTFGFGGAAAPYSAAAGLELLSGGQVLVTGFSAATVPATLPTYTNTHATQQAFARLNADGSLDATYGNGGTALGGDVTPAVGAAVTTGDPVGYAAAVTADGRVLTAHATSPQLVVTRRTTTAAADPSFGSGGTATVPISPPTSSSNRASVALLPLGQAVVLDGDRVFKFQGDATGAGTVLVGGTPDGLATVYSPSSGQYAPVTPLQFFPGFAGSVRTATADVNGDGVPDYIGVPGPGGGPNVVVIDGATGSKIADLNAFESGFTGGLYVTAADLNGDGKAEVIVTPDEGGGPVVVVYDGAGLTAGKNEAAQLTRFFGIDDSAFRGGARAAVGDVNGDGTPDLIVSAGYGGGPRVAVFDGRQVTTPPAANTLPPKLVPDFFVFEDTLRNGVFVAAGDLTGDGAAELVVGGGPGGGPRVLALDGRALAGGTQTPVANFFAGDSNSRGGVHVAVRSAADGSPELVTGSGAGDPAAVQVYGAATVRGSAAPTPDQTLSPFGGATLADGVFVG